MNVSRSEFTIIALAGFFPFCNPHRFAPIAGYWGQWSAVVLFVTWIFYRRLRRSNGQASWPQVPWTAMSFFVLAGLTLLQVAVGSVLFRSGALVAAFELILAGFICIEAADARARDQHGKLTEAFAWGTLAALAANALSISLTRVVTLDGFAAHLLSYSYHGREVGMVGQSNHLGMLAVLAWVGAVFLHSRDRLSAVTCCIFTAVAALLCAASASRTAVVAALLVSALLVAVRVQGAQAETQRPQKKPISKRWLAIALFTFWFIQIAWFVWPQTAHDNTPSVLRAATSGRWEMFRDAILMGWHHPWLGVGFGNFDGSRLFALDGSLAYPSAGHAHNLPAQVWAEWGALGILGVAGSLIVLLWALWRGWTKGPATLEFALASSWVLALLAHSMVEHPLWFAHFLLPFAWMLGLIPQPALRLPPTQPARRPLLALTAVSVWLVCLAAGADYHRSERLATRVSNEIRGPDHTAHISKAEAMNIANLTLFPASAEVMQLRVLDLNAAFSETKLLISTRALRAIPSAETMSRYVAFLSLNGRQQDAVTFLQMIGRRSPSVAKETEIMLGELASEYPTLRSLPL